MRNPFRWIVAPWGLLALGCLLLAGCEAKTATITGQVTYKGKPVSGGSVVFYCQGEQIVRGLITNEGRYSIPNVPLGAAVVTVQSHAKVPDGFRFKQRLPLATNGPIPPTADPNDVVVVTLPPRYALPEESGLDVIVDRSLMTYDLDLKP